MEALILSCGTGGGHNSAGKAVMEELNRRNHHAVMMNPYTLCGGHLAKRIDSTYIGTAQKAPKAFGTIYGAGELYRKLPFRSPIYYANWAMVSRMHRYLEENHYDIVMMPHLFPAEILTCMKRHGMKIPKTIFIATDYCCIPFTEETECDAYVIPAQDLAHDFSDRGIPEEKLYPFGIPVSRGFTEAQSRDNARLRLGLAPDRKYILMAGGSIGAGKIHKLMELLVSGRERRNARGTEKIELIVICGNNRDLYGRLEKEYGQQAMIIGHTDQVADYLWASDLYITKPGGLSSTEAAVSGIPLVHMPPIPGCETHNACYFQRHGMSVSCEAAEKDAEEIFGLLERQEVCAAMEECQKKHISRDAAEQICGLAEEMTGFSAQL